MSAPGAGADRRPTPSDARAEEPLPDPPPRVRAQLAAVLAAFVFLALNASVLTPLFEWPDEKAHFEVAAHWARAGGQPGPGQLPEYALDEAAAPPLPHALLGLVLRALDLDQPRFPVRLRPAPEIGPTRPAQFQHGLDELLPFEGAVLRFHLARLAGVLVGLGALLGTFALGRALAPGRPGLALGAAALLGLQPQFIASCAALHPAPFLTAAGAGCLALAAQLARGVARPMRSALALGLATGAAQWAGPAALVLIPPAWLAAGCSAGCGRRGTLRALACCLGGTALLAVPLWVGHGWGGAPVLPSATDTGLTAAALPFLSELGRVWGTQMGASVSTGRACAWAWTAVALGLLGALARPRGTPRATLAVTWLAVVGGLLFAWTRFAQRGWSHDGLPHVAAAGFACLAALGAARVLRGRAALALLVLLGVLAFRAEARWLGPAYWPPDRAADPFFMATDALHAVPAERRQDSLAITRPGDGERLTDPPTLRWSVPVDSEERFTVHLGVTGLGTFRLYADTGRSVRDRYTLPEQLWSRLPPGVPLECRVLRLLRRDELRAAGPQGPVLHQSPAVRLWRRPR